MITPRISVDFNNMDADGCVRLNTLGAQGDLERLGLTLKAGMRLRVVGDEFRATIHVRAPGVEGVWRGTLVDGMHHRLRRFPHALIRLVDAIGTDAGIGADLPARLGPCYFECIAWDGERSRRLFAVADVPRRTYRHLTRWLGACEGEHVRRLADAPPGKAVPIEGVLSQLRGLLTQPGASLVFAHDMRAAPEKLARMRGLEGRVARVLAQGTPEDIATWDGIEVRTPHSVR